jgi:hypothetical protein
MLSTRANPSRVFISVVPAILAIVAIAIYFSGGASQLLKRSSLVSPAEMRARETFRANWFALNAQVKSQNTGALIPVSGAASASSEQLGWLIRMKQAYAGRLTGLASPQPGMSRAAMDAYTARLAGLAAFQPAKTQRALETYSARLSGLASQKTSEQRAAEAYTARLAGLASQQSGMPLRAITAETARWEAMARYYQSLSAK